MKKAFVWIGAGAAIASAVLVAFAYIYAFKTSTTGSQISFTLAMLTLWPAYVFLTALGLVLRIAGQIYDRYPGGSESLIILSRVPLLCVPLHYVVGIGLFFSGIIIVSA